MIIFIRKLSCKNSQALPWGRGIPSAVGRAGDIWLRPMAWRGFCDLSLTLRGLRLRAHGLHLRAHGLLTRAHRLPLRAHGLTPRAHRLAPRVRNHCQPRPVALYRNNVCATTRNPRALRGNLCAPMSNPFALRDDPCALRANPCALSGKSANPHPTMVRVQGPHA